MLCPVYVCCRAVLNCQFEHCALLCEDDSSIAEDTVDIVTNEFGEVVQIQSLHEINFV